ncbi:MULTISPECIES: ABC transporter permease [Pseudonocardia]|uniref:Transport permease protein n=2 Tax=Pseudonocardia TaxID=1847 RepID=A0A1Y2N2D0_PSEAH|nr:MULTISPECIES: ABC transporter permease [Pseudonocardia]OSY41068.1 Daunorubicin/doxorubicin resistance ABC transporter permease protein DrrB [Pseudonocardia autotrophica]TDN73805.1 ABC-2 type transport system permease protein [Pseudonocardia autotrophica]BBG04551.1 transport permease protein [Pseudonocardia autotrophica]GEC27865.1 transport permease protein [Pseudonocardia saturnea]
MSITTAGPRATGVLTDVGNVWWRETLTIVRDPFSLIFSMLQPLVFLGLFGPLLAGVAGDTGVFGESSLQWFLPGVVVMIAMFGTSMTGANLQFEIMTGAFERMLATPLARSSLMIGRALKELTPLVVQAAIVTLVAVPFGFVLYPLHVLAGLLILGIFGIGVGALSYALAIAARKTEWIFWAVQQSVLFPLLILSGMMLPLETGPAWMRVASLVNPLTWIVDAERVLFAGTFADPVVLWGLLAALATAAVGLTVGVRSMQGASA